MDMQRAGRIEAIEALLRRTSEAHDTYEMTVLSGVYDRAWPQWYAESAVEHGIGALLGQPIDADRLAAFLAESNADFEAIAPKPTEAWATYTARRIATEL